MADDLRQRIEIALSATGQEDVRAARDQFGAFRDVLDRFATPAGSATTATAKLDAALDDQARAAQAAATATQGQATANQAVASSANAAAAATGKAATGAAAAGNAATDAGKKTAAWSRAALDLSRGLEDAQYGFAGFANNIPGIVQNVAGALGMTAGKAALLTAGIGGAATAAFVLYKNFDLVKSAFGEGLPEKIVEDLAAMKKHLEELTGKPWKTVFDFADLNTLLIKIGEAERRKAALNKADQPVESQAERAKAVTKAVVEAGRDGVTGKEVVANAAAAATPPAESTATKEVREKLERVNALLADKNFGMADPNTRPATEDMASRLSDQLRDLRQSDLASHRGAVESRVGGALAGEEGNRQWLEGLFEANRDVFARFQVGDQFGKGLAAASPKAMAEAEKSKELDKAAKQTLQVIGDGFEEAVLRPLAEAARVGADLGAVARSMRGDLAKGIEARGVAPDLAARSADVFLKEQAEKARNLAMTGGMTPGEKKEATAEESETKSLVADLRAGFVAPLVEQLAKFGRKGGDLNEAAEGLRAGLTRDVEGRGVEPEKSGEVAARLLQEALTDVRNILQKGSETPGEKRADSDRKKAIDDAAAGYAGQQRAEADLYTRRQKGQGADEAREDERRLIADDLAREGVAPDLVADAAAKVLRKVEDAVDKAFANGVEPVAVRRVEAERKERVEAIDDPYVAQAEEAIARNRALQARGAPVVRPGREEDAYVQAGMAFALPEKEVGRRVEAAIGRDLQANGEDPTLAADLVAKAMKNQADALTRARATSGDLQEATTQVLARATEAVEKLSRQVLNLTGAMPRAAPRPRPADTPRKRRTTVRRTPIAARPPAATKPDPTPGPVLPPQPPRDARPLSERRGVVPPAPVADGIKAGRPPVARIAPEGAAPALSGDVAGQILPAIEKAVAANRLAREQGRPSVPEIQFRQGLEQRAGNVLRANGRDPGQAPALVGQGFDGVARKVAAMMGSSVDAQQALASIVGGLTQQMDAVLQRQANLNQNLRAVRVQQGQVRMRRGPVGAGASFFGPMMGLA